MRRDPGQIPGARGRQTPLSARRMEGRCRGHITGNNSSTGAPCVTAVQAYRRQDTPGKKGMVHDPALLRVRIFRLGKKIGRLGHDVLANPSITPRGPFVKNHRFFTHTLHVSGILCISHAVIGAGCLVAFLKGCPALNSVRTTNGRRNAEMKSAKPLSRKVKSPWAYGPVRASARRAWATRHRQGRARYAPA